MTRAEMLARIVEYVQRMNDDEVAVLQVAARRLVRAQATYGGLHLATNTHDTDHEATEEAIDLGLWLAIGLLKRERAAAERVRAARRTG